MKIMTDVQCVTEWNSGGLTLFYSSTMLCAGGGNNPSTCFVSAIVSIKINQQVQFKIV